MSKSRDNLVFVSRLRESVDPMTIRLALLGHDHRQDWEWHDSEIDAARERLTRWRTAFARTAAPEPHRLLAELRVALGNGLDTPAAVGAVDRWVDAEGDDPQGGELAAAAVDALLGIIYPSCRGGVSAGEEELK